MSEHTPEPWVVCGYGDSILNEDSEAIVHVSYELGDRAADLRRIVACVNACAGFQVEELEALPSGDLYSDWKYGTGPI